MESAREAVELLPRIMRTGLLFAGLLLSCSPATSSVKITRSEPAGTLEWTNTLCTTTPVYEILRASDITGLWEHVVFVTNQHSFTLAKPIPSGSTAFYQVAWVNDDPMLFDYAFDEHGIGEPSVVGTLTFRLPSSASWFFEETDFNTSNHPLGAGFGPVYTTSTGEMVAVLDYTSDDGFYLEGVLQANSSAGACAYTYAGTVNWINFASTVPIGTFVARQR